MKLTPREQAEVEKELGLAVPPVTPSPELKASIMAKIAATPQLSAEKSIDSVAEVETGETGSASQKARSRWFPRPVVVLVAAAAAVILFAGGLVLGIGLSGNRALDAQAQSLAVLTSASDLQRATGAVAGGGEATLLWSLDQRTSAILVKDLPTLAEGKTYQLWYIGGDGPIPAGTFESSVSATTWRVLDGTMSEGDTVGITVEPAGGSAKPTTTPIVAIASS